MTERYGLSLTYYQYKGFHSGREEKHNIALKELEPEIEEMKKHIHVYDYVSNPTGMYKTVQRFMNSLGTKTEGIVEMDDFGNKYQSFNFVYDNPDTQVMVITDHLGLINPEKNPFDPVLTGHDAMRKWSEYCVKFIAKKYQCIVVQIQQQAMNSDGTENIRMGRPEPSLDKAGKNKEVIQDSQVVIGLFNPVRINPPMTSYGGYNLKDFGNHFRSIHLLKHREGDPDVIKCMYFHGVSCKYEELPKPNTPELTQFINKLKQ